MNRPINLGAVYLGEGCCRFRVWAPRSVQVAVHLLSPQEKVVPLAQEARGYHGGILKGVTPGSLYFYQLDGVKERPDPASRYQPRGVHGPSQVVDTRTYRWTDRGWRGPTRQELIFYELHVGTFTATGTFDGVIAYLDRLRELGITAVELMPVAQFPGSRNWGYDGVYPFAVQDSYGGPAGLQRLVDACHRCGLAVLLDVVYNHLGPEGNYLDDFGPYFTDRYHTPWGRAVNFDGPGSDAVRHFFIANALYWITEFHMDGLRLDAVHAILDFSARPFLAELAAAIHRRGKRLGRRVYVIAESDLNDSRVIRSPTAGGYGLDAQWSDDFHHSLQALLTGENHGYYQDFGNLKHLAKAFREGYVYTGQYSAYRERHHGNRPRGCPASRFVVFSQNHDQVGNRARGERLASLTSFEGYKLAAAAVLLSPFLPLLFMGEEYGETAPFQYFTSHTNQELAAAVRQGRRKEFAAFNWEDVVPDPQNPATFRRSRLQPQLDQERPAVLYALYHELLRWRRELAALAKPGREKKRIVVCTKEQVLVLRRGNSGHPAWIALCFNKNRVTAALPLPAGSWRKVLDTAETCWLGPGSTAPFILHSAGEVRVTLPPYTCILWEPLKEALRP